MTATGRAAPLSPDRRRTALIDSTLPLLREYGDAVTTRQIAHACGIAEGTIFRVFPDKESLIAAALGRALDPTDMIAEIAGIDPTLPLEPRLRATAAILHDRLTGVFALLGAMRLNSAPGHSAGHSPPNSPGHSSGQRPNSACHTDHRARQAEIIEAVTDVLRPDEHLLRRSPTEVAQLLRALIFSGAHPLISAEAPLTSDEIVTILLDGVRRPGGSDDETDGNGRC
ncbi:MAG: TetR/AcrR family transcriptional regulator [Geodermatophilaceae bacterium]|nr:TetR/AcrR family transcriptional regulator [Geodermatophilaceae bacterium]